MGGYGLYVNDKHGMVCPYSLEGKRRNFSINNKENCRHLKEKEKAKVLKKVFFPKKGKNVKNSNKSIERNFH